jgi:hypothetical protein
METHIAAGPVFQLLSHTTVVFVNQLYIAVTGKDPGHGAPIDVIEDHASHLFMTNVYVQWGVAQGLANSVVHIVEKAPHMYHELGTFYPTEDPAKATIWVESSATDVTVSSLWTNRGKPSVGSLSKLLDSNPLAGLNIPLSHPGAFRVTNNASGKDLVKIDNNPNRPALHTLNSVDAVGFSDNYITEKWRIVGQNGAARFAGGKFKIDGAKGYVGLNTDPFDGAAMLIRPASPNDLGLAIIRPASAATRRLMEFQDEAHNPQGLAIDSNGRPIAVGEPPQVTAGPQANYAKPDPQVRDMAGSITAEVRPSPTAKGAIASITFSRPYAAMPLYINLSDRSGRAGDLYVSSSNQNGFTVSTRRALPGGTILHFGYLVIA